MIGNESRIAESTQDVQGTADVLTATGDHNGTFRPGQPVTLVGIGADITTATVSSGDIVVKFDKRPTKGSDTNRGDGDVGTLNIVTGLAATKVVYKNITPIDLDPGMEVVPEVTTAAAGGGAAGGCHYLFHYVPRAEKMANISGVVISA